MAQKSGDKQDNLTFEQGERTSWSVLYLTILGHIQYDSHVKLNAR